jgi:hypothetical protein
MSVAWFCCVLTPQAHFPIDLTFLPSGLSAIGMRPFITAVLHLFLCFGIGLKHTPIEHAGNQLPLPSAGYSKTNDIGSNPNFLIFEEIYSIIKRRS